MSKVGSVWAHTLSCSVNPWTTEPLNGTKWTTIQFLGLRNPSFGANFGTDFYFNCVSRKSSKKQGFRCKGLQGSVPKLLGVNSRSTSEFRRRATFTGGEVGGDSSVIPSG